MGGEVVPRQWGDWGGAYEGRDFQPREHKPLRVTLCRSAPTALSLPSGLREGHTGRDWPWANRVPFRLHNKGPTGTVLEGLESEQIAWQSRVGNPNRVAKGMSVFSTCSRRDSGRTRGGAVQENYAPPGILELVQYGNRVSIKTMHRSSL